MPQKSLSLFTFFATPTMNKPTYKHLMKHKPQHAKAKTRTFNLEEHKQKKILSTFKNKNKMFSFQKEK
jgi:hypothetical protein